ncbi:MAG TPA: hypothetical protein VIN03_16620 [Roseateles sp.]
MKPSRAPKYLADLVAHYEAKEAEVKNLQRRVRELTRQRDRHAARNAELRAHVNRYQKALAQREHKSSAWEPA